MRKLNRPVAPTCLHKLKKTSPTKWDLEGRVKLEVRHKPPN